MVFNQPLPFLKNSIKVVFSAIRIKYNFLIVFVIKINTKGLILQIKDFIYKSQNILISVNISEYLYKHHNFSARKFRLRTSEKK